MALKHIALLVLLCSFAIVQSAEGFVTSDCDNLEKEVNEVHVAEAIFKNRTTQYWQRPVRNGRMTVGVDLDLFFRTLVAVNERGQSIQLTGYLWISWWDQFHIWNETSPLDCIQEIVLPHGKQSGLWIPDIVFSSTLRERYELTRSPLESVRISSDGRAVFAPGGLFESHCEFNLALFPFDEQTCTLVFESWRYKTNRQYFNKWSMSIDKIIANRLGNEEWWFVGGQSHRFTGNYSTGQFDWVEFEITIKRKSGYYALTLVLPCLLIAAVEIVTFTIPLVKAVRLEVSFTCLLAYSMFQSIMTAEMPHSADHPPLLLILISLFTIYMAIAIFLQGMGLILAGKARRGEHVLHRLLLLANFLAPLVCLPRIRQRKPSANKGATPGTVENNGSGIRLAGFLNDSLRQMNIVFDESQPDEESNHAGTAPWHQTIGNSEAWLFIARVLDRVSCLFFILLLVVTSIVILLLVPGAANQLATAVPDNFMSQKLEISLDG